jgi:MFS superfamily sulfate permease-like transporter
MGALGIVLVLTAETLAAGRTFASKHKYQISPNRELFAVGVANVTSGLFGGMIVGGGMSGTAANDEAGARTQLSTLTASAWVAITLAFLLPLFRNLPEAVLGAIVIHAVAHLLDIGTLKYYARLKTGSLWIALAALLGVLQVGILKGLIFAVGLTLIALMHKLSSPQDSVLGRLPGSDNFVDVASHPEAEQIPGLLIFRPNGLLFFANANRIYSRLRELEDRAGDSLRAIVINLEASPEMDVTSLETFIQLRTELQKSAKDLYLARVAEPVRGLFERSGFLEDMRDHLFPGVDSAVKAFLSADSAPQNQSEKRRSPNLVA